MTLEERLAGLLFVGPCIPAGWTPHHIAIAHRLIYGRAARIARAMRGERVH